MSMQSKHFSFQPFENSELKQLTSVRSGEVKLGEAIHLSPTDHTRFIILGICESIGPRANNGIPGAENAFDAFLTRFLNMQSNRYLSGKEICLPGKILQHRPAEEGTHLSTIVEELDDLVIDVLSEFSNENSVLIIIGGGHNNAYPIIKSIHQRMGIPLHVLNLDPHADCRATEGRHSGNPFSYALNQGHLSSYNVMGLHQAYNNETILNFLEENNSKFSFYDDIISGKTTFEQQLSEFITYLNGKNPVGIELDMDAIAFSPSSAYTPSGVNADEARKYVSQCSAQLKPVYLHLPEAAPVTELDKKISGKLLAYLTYDFIRNHPIRLNELKI